MERTFNRILLLIQNHCEVDDSIVITSETTFSELELDSLDIVDLAMACEDEFDITFDVEEPPMTMGELVALVDSLIDYTDG